jgi:hypothetical protein
MKKLVIKKIPHWGIPWYITAVPILVFWWLVFCSVVFIVLNLAIPTFIGLFKGIEILLAEPFLLVPSIFFIVVGFIYILRRA